MSLAHFSVWKLAALAGGLAAAIVVVDPTVKVAMVVGATAISTALITSGTALLIRRMDRKDRAALQSSLTDVKHSVDGTATLLKEQLDSRTAELGTATTRADRAEAKAEGVASERGKRS